MRSLGAAASVAAAVAVVGAALVPSAASATSGPRTSLVLMLRPTSETALHALATRSDPRLTVAQRRERLAALTPSTARVAAVAQAARRLGLTVRRTSAWSVWADAPAGTVTGEFGRLRAHDGAAGRSFPALPSALRPYVVAALPTSGRVARPLATSGTRSGADFRSAYSAPSGSTGTGTQIATVQLSGWNQRTDGGCAVGTGSSVRSCDLQSYANRNGVSFDVNKQYVATDVELDSPKQMQQGDGYGGDEEVALDQEAILSTAPAATQRVYFAPNDDGGAGYVHAVEQVATDALQIAKDPSKPQLVALSLSWGGCEPSDDRGWITSMDLAMEKALAAGVTIFAASGDAGSDDCYGEITGARQYAPAVDFPASSPYAVAVGGVNLPGPGEGAAAGWSGSGGGESTVEQLPSWQNNVSARSRTNHRLLPDIASDAYPDNGFVIYDSLLGNGTNQDVLAGTSLASPTQAALLADTLQAAGWHNGVGDIHPALYQGAGAGAVTDIKSDLEFSGNGDYRSVAGYDLVTGLGTPVWSTLRSWLGEFDVGTPRATRTTSFAIRPHAPSGFDVSSTYQSWSPAVVGSAAACSDATAGSPPSSAALPADAADGTYVVSVAGQAQPAPGTSSPSCYVASGRVVLDRQLPTTAASLRVTGSGGALARWSFADPSPSSGLRKFVVELSAGGKVRWRRTTTNRSHAFSALPYRKWDLRVTAYDNAGNATTTTAHLQDDAGLRFGSAWARAKSAAAYRGSYASATRPGVSVRVRSLTGSTFVLYVRTCRSCGKVGVYDGQGHRLSVVDTYSRTTHYRVARTVLRLRAAATRTLVLKVLAGKNKASSGRAVAVDAIAYG